MLSSPEPSIPPNPKAEAPLVEAPAGPWQRRLHRGLLTIAEYATVVLLVVLGIRSVARLDTWWDSWLYHIPFAAVYGRLGIPFTSRPEIQGVFEGFPPLPFLAHALLWRLTGSLHAIGVRNWLAFLAFLFFTHRVLRARVQTVGVVALTTPLVLIHLTTTYYDLFVASFLAMAVSGCVSALLFERWHERRLLIWILVGLVLASWSKSVVSPIIALLFLFLFAKYASGRMPDRSRFLLYVGAAALVASLPYLKNLALYHNPLWPYPVPLVSKAFPYASYWTLSDTRPPPLADRPQIELFLRSFLEIGHPTSYSYRPRWTIDQGATPTVAFRSGGYWAPAAVAYFLGMLGLVALFSRRKVAWLAIAVLVLLGLYAALPYSHQLRYLMFMPLTWAAVIGMLEHHFAPQRPVLMSGLLAVSLTMLGYMAWVNEPHLRVERVTYADAARYWGQIGWWDVLENDAVYCTVGQPQPNTFLLTGPTSREFTIHERGASRECQPGEVILDWHSPPSVPASVSAQVQSLMTRGLELATAKDHESAIPLFREASRLNPEHHGARWQLANALELAGHTQEALKAWKWTVALELLRGYEDANCEHARARVRALSRTAGLPNIRGPSEVASERGR